MKVFLTSATGFIGAQIAAQLVSRGDTVVALARTDKRAAELEAAGFQPVLGNLTSPDVLKSAARDADGVIHTAYTHDGSITFEQAAVQDLCAIAAFADAMAGSNKPLVITSGTGVLGDTGDIVAGEDFPLDVDSNVSGRSRSERAAILAAGRGVRSVALRLPPYVYGRGGPGFIAWQLASFRKAGSAHWVGDPEHKVSAVHVDDCAAGFLAALDQGPPGSLFHLANETGLRAKAIAEAMAKRISAKQPATGLKSVEEAVQKDLLPGWVAGIISINNQTSCDKAETILGWRPPQRPGMVHDIIKGFCAADA